YMTQEMVQFEEMRTDENVSMQVYCFTNYNQGPELEIFHMPAPVFRFLRYASQGEFKTAWSEIVRSGYRKVNWAKVKSEEDYKNRPNLVYENLLQGRSILRSFLNQRARKPRGNWELLFLYLNKVRTMKQARLDKLKQVGDFIAESIRESGRDRRLTQLERAKSYRECRNVLRFVVRDRISQGAQQPLFSIDDYVEHLFPATDNVTFWSETRDLLLFRIYEQLHDWLQTQGFVAFDEDETPGATESNEENE
ncbi:type I-B CRISPR-associated protein Cas8b1/Cst1, partial [Candidatus Poribacteria bacterium]